VIFVFLKCKSSFWGEIRAEVDFGKSGGGVCLVGKILLEVGGVFLSYLEAPSYHIFFVCLKKSSYFIYREPLAPIS